MQTDTSVLKLATNLIIPNKYQPRKIFDVAALNSLSESIKKYGIINPILVRKKDDKYEIIAGERRFRAAQQAGLTEVPVIVKTADEQQMAELALIENIQRQGLSPIEEAKSYEEIMRIGNQTQQSLAEKIGKSQSSIANKIRLLSLPEEIQDALNNKKISERHARSLINVTDQERQKEILNRIINEKLTVKETEQLIKEKEISQEEIKQAISDIMKSLNIHEEPEKEEKEDDNMNNGNFFPNFDNNNAANNSASLNMMNMQSMNQQPVKPEPEVVMPTVNAPVQEPQLIVPTNPVDIQPQQMPSVAPTIQSTPDQLVKPLEQISPSPVMAPEININNNLNPMDNFMNQPPMASTIAENNTAPIMPTIEPPIMNDAPLFGPQPEIPPVNTEIQPQQMVQVTTPMEDIPLFNQNVAMPNIELSQQMPEVTSSEPQLVVPENPNMESNVFEVPLSNIEPLGPPVVDRLNELQNLLSANGYNYKVYSNERDNCVIIELPKN